MAWAWGKTSNITVWRWVYVTHPFSLFLSLFRLLTLIPHPLLLPLFLSSSSLALPFKIQTSSQWGTSLSSSSSSSSPSSPPSDLIPQITATKKATPSLSTPTKLAPSTTLGTSDLTPFHCIPFSFYCYLSFSFFFFFFLFLQRNLPLLRPSLLWTRFASLLFIKDIFFFTGDNSVRIRDLWLSWF